MWSRVSEQRAAKDRRLFLATTMLILAMAIVGCGTSGRGSGTLGGSSQPSEAGSGSEFGRSGGDSVHDAPNQEEQKEKEVDFRGKTIEVVVNYTAGGPTDTFNRLIAQYVSNYIPGNPTVVVRNVGGAGGMVGANQVYASPKKDGTVIGGFTLPVLPKILGDPGAQFDLEKFEWLAAAQEASLYYVRADTGVKKPADILNPAQPIRFGGLGPTSNLDFVAFFFLDWIGADYKHVHGYPGIADIRKAFLQGEVNMMDNSLTDYFGYIHPLVENGEVVVIAQSGLLQPNGEVIRDPRIPDVPTTLEVLEEALGRSPYDEDEMAAFRIITATRTLLRGIVLPPGTDPGVVTTLRKAYDQAFADPEFRKSAFEQLSFEFDYIPGEEAKNLTLNLLHETVERPKAVELLRRMAGL